MSSHFSPAISEGRIPRKAARENTSAASTRPESDLRMATLWSNVYAIVGSGARDSCRRTALQGLMSINPRLTARVKMPLARLRTWESEFRPSVFVSDSRYLYPSAVRYSASVRVPKWFFRFEAQSFLYPYTVLCRFFSV